MIKKNLMIDMDSVFYKDTVFKKIQMICTLTENGGLWVWFDHKGENHTELPQCIVWSDIHYEMLFVDIFNET